jgi:hypothetical protein
LIKAKINGVAGNFILDTELKQLYWFWKYRIV